MSWADLSLLPYWVVALDRLDRLSFERADMRLDSGTGMIVSIPSSLSWYERNS